MKNILLGFATIILLNLSVSSKAQHVYSVSNGEMIFSWADAQLTPEYLSQYPGASIANTPVRFTMFLHLGQYIHMDFGNNIGLFTGMALRNVGFITDEVLPAQDFSTSSAYQDYKIIRRSYTLGIPLALKLGSFKDHLYIFGGGEYEWAFLWKEKYWNQHSRDGSKSKNTEWWPNQMQTFIPSVFAGIQFPKGFNIKFKYYLDEFINLNYSPNNDPSDLSDLTRYETAQTMCISVSWQFANTAKRNEQKVEGITGNF